MKPPHPPTPDQRLVYEDWEPMPALRKRQLSWVWLNPIEVGDLGYPAGFPSTTNEALRRAGDGRWVLTTGVYVAKWIETNCVLANGRWIGKPFKLQQWQKRLLAEMFEVNIETGLRKFRWNLIGLPKKNGKTEITAALALYFLHGEGEPAPNIIAAASSKEQADLLFGSANTMIAQSHLKDALKGGSNKILARDQPMAFIHKVAAVEGANDGKNVFVCLIDELHEWKETKHIGVWNVLTNGLGSRLEPMIIQITTAGSDLDTICGAQYEHLKEVRDGLVEDEALYGVWWECIDREDDPTWWRTEEAVRSCNPSYGVTVHWQNFADQLKQKSEAIYRRYFLNQWTEAEEIWEAAALWPELAGSPRWDVEKPLFVGIDVGLKHDSAAVIWVQWLDTEEDVLDEEGNPTGETITRPKLHVHKKIWLNPYAKTHSGYTTWRLNLAEVESALKLLYLAFPVGAREDEDDWLRPGPAFFYDPHFFERSAQTLSDDGLHMIDYPQSVERMVDCSQRIFEIIKAAELVHDGDAEMKRQVRSVIAKEVDRGWRITKPKGSSKRIDAMIALAIAGREATRPEDVDDGPNLW